MQNADVENAAGLVASYLRDIARVLANDALGVGSYSLAAAMERHELLTQEDFATLDDALYRARKLQNGGYKNWADFSGVATNDL